MPWMKVSDDNPYSESLFKTVKYHPTFPAISRFDNIIEARTWMIRFTDWYNNHHLHSGLKFITPSQRHEGLDSHILNNRHQVYQKAKAKHPERWSRGTRNWSLPVAITLNPERKAMAKNDQACNAMQ